MSARLAWKSSASPFRIALVFSDPGCPTSWQAPLGARTKLLGEAQRMLANEAVNGFLYQPPWVSVANKNVKCLWKDVPIFANDLSALSWGK